MTLTERLKKELRIAGDGDFRPWSQIKKAVQQIVDDAECEAPTITKTLGDIERSCTHAHYNWEQHGRRCTCGAVMVDWDD